MDSQRKAIVSKMYFSFINGAFTARKKAFTTLLIHLLKNLFFLFYMMSTLLIKRVMRWVVVICLIRDNIFPLIVVQVVLQPIRLPLRKKCPYSELFWSAFNCASLRMQSECGKMQTKTTPSTNIFYAVHVQGKDKLLMLYSSLTIQGAIW